MPNRVAFTDQQKARLFERLIERDVIRMQVGPREVGDEMVERTYIKHGDANDILVVED